MATESLYNESNKFLMCPRCEERQPLRDFATLGMAPLNSSRWCFGARCAPISSPCTTTHSATQLNSATKAPMGDNSD